MKVCGIVAEYDPFHLGHLYHLQQARLQTNADYVVCVLSTAFLQRGVPSLFSTQARTQMALENGADAVFSLPVHFSCADAERFSFGSISILHALGFVSDLMFGSENDDLELLQMIADTLENEPPAYKQFLKEGLRNGSSHAKAQGEALSQYLQVEQGKLSTPNNVLSICYLRALKKLQSPILPHTLKRLGDYHGRTTQGFLSASAIRKKLLAEGLSSIKAHLPKESFDIVRSQFEKGMTCNVDALDDALLYRVRSMDVHSLMRVPQVNEGLENLLKKASFQATTRAQLLAQIKSKRYTHTRLSRILAHVLLQTDARTIPSSPLYTRLLGFRKSAQPMLSMLKQSAIPVVSKSASSKELLTDDAWAETLWAQGAKMPPSFFKQSPIIV